MARCHGMIRCALPERYSSPSGNSSSSAMRTSRSTTQPLPITQGLPRTIPLAARPATGGPSAPKVLYILKGKLSAYSPYNAPNNGSITIVVGHANYHGRALKGQTLTFPLGPRSRVTLADGLTTITDND